MINAATQATYILNKIFFQKPVWFWLWDVLDLEARKGKAV